MQEIRRFLENTGRWMGSGETANASAAQQAAPNLEETMSPITPNRSLRRKQARARLTSGSGLQILAEAINQTSSEYRQAADEWRGVINDPADPSGVSALYQPQHARVIVHFAERMRSLSILIGQAENFKGKQPVTIHNRETEIYTYPVRGLSLAKIEKMSTPLSLNDIQLVNKFLSYSILFYRFMTPQARTAQEVAIRLPIATLANPQVKIPDTLKGLNRAITDYFDYFMSFFNYPNEADQTQQLMFCSAALHAGRRLCQGLGAFMPARLGITPASALRLFEEPSIYYSMPIAWRMLRRNMEPLIRHAYRIRGLPSALSQWQHYDDQAEKEVTQYLQGYVQPQAETDDDLLIEMNRSIRTLRAVALEQEEGFRRVTLDHPLFEAITIATQYKRSLIIAAHLRGVDSRLVLEVNGDHRIYGIPVNLLRENPHCGEILARDLFPPVLELAYQRDPHLRSQSSIRLTPVVVLDTSFTPTEEAHFEVDMKQEPPKILKRRNLGIFSKPQELPQRPSTSGTKPQFTVFHSRSRINELMGRTSTSDVDGIMNAIHRFELGSGNRAKTLAKDSQLTSLRVGDLRVILKDLGDGNYSIVRIGDRRNVYRRL